MRLSRTTPDFLFGLGCVYGADTCASAAVSAETCVDYVFSVIADRNSACGTFSFASAAADAIVRNFVCHFNKPPCLRYAYSNTYSGKIK